MKHFEDLKFYEHELAAEAKALGLCKYENATHAVMYFPNGYGISVICGKDFYSNGVDEYEVAVLKDGGACCDTVITDSVLAYKTREQIDDIMEQIQKL